MTIVWSAGFFLIAKIDILLFFYLLILTVKIKLNKIGQMSKVFANGPGDYGSIPVQVISKTQKMVLDAALLYTQHYKVWIKGKVEQSREWRSALPCTSV